ncbi:hypothetical protein KAK06_01840 [Ideonella sp. 4Y11]|uniref:Uncharacterized protein n=1 Tax=Ideonella aquatica TaxID=2824119 RepID=A0A941BJN8_9BURK|nr:hypothetical protein [Ideonella aquatica]MBQ0957689.1 hypothetical protein [Ideonella aquatica]
MKRRWVGVGAGLAIGLWLLWMRWPEAMPAVTDQAVPAASQAVAPRVPSASTAGVRAARGEVADPVDPELPALGPACGYGPWLGDDALPDAVARARVDRALGRQVVSTLQQSSSELDQAVGWWLASTPFNVIEPALQDCTGRGCQTALQQAQERVERAAPRRDQASEKLLSLAQASQDPAVVALALSQCASAPQPPACRAELSARWVALEPDNAAGWLAQAQVAQEAGDPAGVVVAFHQATQAAHNRPPSAWVARHVVALLPAEWQGLPRLSLQLQLLGSVARLQGPNAAMFEHCRDAGAAGQANRQQACERLAERLLRDAPDLLSWAVATGLGRQARWPAERLAALKAEREQLEALFNPLRLEHPPGSPGECRAHQRGSAWLERSVQMGELAHLRSLRPSD